MKMGHVDFKKLGLAGYIDSNLLDRKNTVMKKRAKALITLFLSICIFNSCASERDPVIAQGLKDLIAFMIEGIDFPVDQRQILFLRQDTPIWRFGDVSQAVLECLQKEFESKNVYIFMWSESTEDEFGSVISKADSTYGICIGPN